MPQTREVLIALGELGDDRVLRGAQLLPIGEWRHKFGRIKITPRRARHFVHQFENNVAGQDLPVLYIHHEDKNRVNPQFGKAAGWVRSMTASDDKGVSVDIEFTEEGAEEVRAGRYKYLSAEYFDQVQLSHHDKVHKDVIVGMALVNRPHLKGMTPILNEETGHQFLIEEAEETEAGPKGGHHNMDPVLVALAESAGIKLLEGQSELTDEQREIVVKFDKDQQSESDAKDEKITKLEAEVAEANPGKQQERSLAEAGFVEEAKELAIARGERYIRELADSVPDGHVLAPAVETELRAFAVDSDPVHTETIMATFAAGNGTVDLEEHGTSGGGDDDDEDADAVAGGDKITKLAEQLIKDDDKLSMDDAVDRVLETDEGIALYNAEQVALGSKAKVVV